MESPKCYEDIGHGLACQHSAIWYCTKIFHYPWSARPNEKLIFVRSARKATHETTWGKDVMRYWRGRFDTKTRQVSVQQPHSEVSGGPVPYDMPDILIDLLVKEFGSDIEVWQFNPPRRRK